MKYNYFLLLFLILLIPSYGFTQAVHQTYSSKFDTVGFIPPFIPGGYDSLFSSIEKIKLTDSGLIMDNTIYDALIKFTLTETGSITKYSYKGMDVVGATAAIQNCITSLHWVPGKSKNGIKTIKSDVQINFTYQIVDGKIKILQKEPLYVFNYKKTKKINNKIILSCSILMLGIFTGGGIYIYVLL